MSRAVFHDHRLALRGRLEAAIEQAITALDHMDGDPDLEGECDEDDHDGEPSLCGVSFGWGRWDGLDLEPPDVRPFQLDQRQAERTSA